METPKVALDLSILIACGTRENVPNIAAINPIISIYPDIVTIITWLVNKEF